MTKTLLAIDQGTTSSRAIRFSLDGGPLQTAQQEFPQIYPQPGWVEHDVEAIWATALAVTREAMADDVAAIGITNQRETIVIWDRATGVPIHNAIVWQDRRTADLCAAIKAEGVERLIQGKTGLLLDPYFSATKIKWLLENVTGARDRAERGELAAGTIDSFLLWRLTGGRVHATDWTNAGRTMLYDIHAQQWDAELLKLFEIPASLLPVVYPNAHHFGDTDPGVLGKAVPVFGMAGDQHAALLGQACFAPGMVKSTYGTGCFMLMNTGSKALASTHRLLTTPGYEIGDERAYALEGSIFVAGAAVKWLRDKLCLVDSAQETETLARAAKDDHGVTVIPAFVGLGAPHWRADVRGSVHGLTLDTTAADLVRATLESIAFQTRDLTDAMAADGAPQPSALRIDGGMAQNSWFAQFLADMLNVSVEMPASHETTALGAAALAGIGAGLVADTSAFAAQWQAESRWTPEGTIAERLRRLDQWHTVLARAL